MSKVRMDIIDQMFPTSPLEEQKLIEETNEFENKYPQVVIKEDIQKKDIEKKTGDESKKVKKNYVDDNTKRHTDNEEIAKEPDYFVVNQKKTFRETHSQQNIWIENELRRDLDEIFKDKQKGFKTDFYNAALRFAIKRYRTCDKKKE